MKINYKGCEIEVKREKCLAGYDLIYYNIFDDGFEVTSGFSEGEDKVRDFANDLKNIVDDYREHPQDYDDDYVYGENELYGY